MDLKRSKIDWWPPGFLIELRKGGMGGLPPVPDFEFQVIVFTSSRSFA